MLKPVTEKEFVLPLYSDEWYIHQYLLHGSVERAYIANRWDIKISPASFHRLVKKYGIVKSAGRREASLTELLHFFAQKALEPTTGIETIYFQKMPPSFQTSLATLHRTYQNILNLHLTRNATALVIHPHVDSKQVLVGQEVTTKRRYGKFKGDYSLPMTFSQDGESPQDSVLRVLQQEVLTKLAISGQLSQNSTQVSELIPKDIEPIFNFHILDVCVQVYRINLPLNFSADDIHAAKLRNLHFVDMNNPALHFRTGIEEILEYYTNYLEGTTQDISLVSDLNRAILGVSV